MGSWLRAGRAHRAEPLARGRDPTLPHLELLIKLGVHIQTDEHGLCETCWGVEESSEVTEELLSGHPESSTTSTPHWLTCPSKFHQQFGQCGGEQHCLVAPRKAAYDLL